MSENKLQMVEGKGNTAKKKSGDTAKMELCNILTQMDFLVNACYSFAEAPHQVEGECLEGLARSLDDVKYKIKQTFIELEDD